MTEHWQQWKPIPDLLSIYSIKNTIDHLGCVSFILESTDNSRQQVLVDFIVAIEAYFAIEKTMQAKRMQDLSEQYGADFLKWTFFKVVNSSYLAGINMQLETVPQLYNWQHYCLIGSDLVIDIIARYEPIILII